MSRLLAWRRRALQGLMRGLFALTTRVSVTGRDKLPTGAALLACNHLSHADPVLLLTVLPKPPEVMALELLRRRLIAPLFYLYAPIPVHRGEVDRALLREVLAALAAGRQVVIFPEGRISRTGALEEAMEGIGYLALQAAVPVVPIAVTGTEGLLERWRRGRRPHLSVTIGSPFMPRPDPAQPRRVQRQLVTAAIMSAIAAPLPPAYRGVYGTGAGEPEGIESTE